MARDTAETDSSAEVSPASATLAKVSAEFVFPASAAPDVRHGEMGLGVPVVTTRKLAAWPTTAVTPVGWIVIVGAAVVTAAGPVSVRSGTAKIRAPTRVVSR